jgi:hypothetical protein
MARENKRESKKDGISAKKTDRIKALKRPNEVNLAYQKISY